MGAFRDYYHLTKPGIIRGNALTAAAGFFLASKGHSNWRLFLETLAGISLVIASACVLNNYIDRGIDAKMARTKKRALVSGAISARNALAYASVLGLAGALVLAVYTNVLTVAAGLVGFVFYIVFYGLSKRHSIYGTLIGSVSGATPPVAGYLAVTNHFDTAALLLFLILVCWQMPHFYAIALYRLKDYTAAGLPVLPAKKDSRTVKLHMLLYVLAFVAAAVLLFVFGYTGYVYLASVIILGSAWLWLCLQGYKAEDDKLWARRMFLFSLLAITVLCIVISASAWLP